MCLLSIDNFDLHNYKKVSNNIYIGKDISLDTCIYRYIRLEHLIDLLETTSLFVPNRKFFSDKREVGKKQNLKNLFRFTPCHMTDIDKKYYTYLSQQIEESHNICISCWTYDKLLKNKNNENIENYLMWKSYSYSHIGVRIKTTIKDFLCSIQNLENTIIANSVIYKKESADYSVNDSIFTKTEHYIYEDEFRVSILSTNDYIRIPINTESMLHQITISPFTQKRFYNILKEFLESKYPFLAKKIIKSEINEY